METETNKIVLKKEIGLHHSIAIGIGSLIGSGIFVSPVGILSHMGSIGMSLILWFICGLCQLMFALCYAELGCRIPLSGGEYTYINHIYGGYLACIRVWSAAVSFVLVQMALFGIFSRYVSETIYYSCDPPEIIFCLVYFLALSAVVAVNYYSVKLVARLQIVFTTAKLVALAGVIILGVIHMAFGEIGQLRDPFNESNYSPLSFTLAFFSGTWALHGWGMLCCITGEMKRPKRDLRASLVISLGATSFIYMLANVAYASVLTKEEMLSSPAVAVSFAMKTMGPFAWIMSLCVAVSTLGTSMGTVLAQTRVLHMGAKQGHMPYILSFISVERRTPAVCIFYMGVLAMIGVIWKNVFYLLELIGFINVLFEVVTILALLIVRRKDQGKRNDIVKAPVAVAEVSFLIVCLLLVMTIYKRPLTSLVVLFVVFGVFTAMYLIFVKSKRKPKSFVTFRDSLTIILQKLLVILPEEDK